MKRVATILIPLFLLISIAITVYIVLTQKMEVRKKAQEVGYTTSYGPPNFILRDWCDLGPYVEIEALGSSYDSNTGVQTLNLKARRVASASATPTVTPSVTPQPTGNNISGIIFLDCENNGQLDYGEPKVDIETDCQDGTAVWRTSVTLTGPGIVSGQYLGDPSLWLGSYSTEPVPTPGQQYTASLNINPSCKWKVSNSPAVLTVPQQGVVYNFGIKESDWVRNLNYCPTPTPTLTPIPTQTNNPGVVQGIQALAAVEYRVPLGEDLVFETLEEGCYGSIASPSACVTCTESSPGFFRTPVKHIIPAGQTELDFLASITKPTLERLCGCSQLVTHVWDVSYPVPTPGVASLTQADCNTVIPDTSHPTHEYLFAMGLGDNCLAVPTATPSATLIPVTPTITPTPTSAGTPTPNQIPVCTGLSVSPTTGTAPLTVHFVGSGTDPDGPIMKWEFNYGDGKIQQIEKNIGESGSVEIDHTYTTIGQFIASFRILDNNGVWSPPKDACSVTIITNRASQAYVPVAGQPQYVAPTVTLTPVPRATVTPTPTTARIAQAPSSTPTPTRTTTVVRSTVTPEATRVPTRTPAPTRVASRSATIVEPVVPKSGGILPTIGIGLVGLLIIGLGLLVAL